MDSSEKEDIFEKLVLRYLFVWYGYSHQEYLHTYLCC